MNRCSRAALFSLALLVLAGAAAAVGLHRPTAQRPLDAPLQRLRSVLPAQPRCQAGPAAHGLGDLIWIDKMPKTQDDPFEAYFFGEGGIGARLVHAKGRTTIDEFSWSADASRVDIVLRFDGQKIRSRYTIKEVDGQEYVALLTLRDFPTGRQVYQGYEPG